MDYDPAAISTQSIRQMDTNSLMRLFDRASAASKNARIQLDRLKADKAIQRIHKELLRRNT